MSDSESALMSGQTADADDAPTSMTVADLVDAVSDSVAGSVVGPLSARLDALESRLDTVAGRAQVDGLSERVDALSGAAVTQDDLATVSASLSSQMEQVTLQAGEIGPVLDEEVGPVIIELVGKFLEIWDGDGDGTSDVASLVSEIHADVQSLSSVLVHPFMTTPLSDFSVLEGLLLLLLLLQFVKFWISSLEDGFSWLR